MAGKVIHFEVPIDDAERARAFYGGVFGWSTQEFAPGMGYWPTDAGTGPGIGGALTQRSAESPGLMFYIAVDDVDATLAAVAAAGGAALTPRMPIPGVGWMAFIQDTEGNRVGLFQSDPAATMPEGAPGS
ncbi:MAG: VOC family protein [Deltaproteobacteria bacterium]|nr:VOC family protein [Deltaproteobacteria bacterium]